MILVFSVLVAVAVVAAVVGIAGSRQAARERQLADRLEHAAGRHPEVQPRTIEIERDRRYSAMPWFDALLAQIRIGQRLELLLYQAGMTMRAGVLVVLMAVLGMAGYVIALGFTHRLFPALALGGVLAPLPYLYVVYKKNARMKAFAREFPDALDLLVSGLRAGLSFTAAMQVVAEESPEPVRSEFAIAVEEQALGLDSREALVNLTQRVDVVELRFFVTAVLLQRETGGNLAEVLTNNARLIRDRFRVLGDIETFTAQGKMTAMILIALPLGVGVFTYSMAPEYFVPMLTTEAGRKALWFAAGMQLLGILAIRKIVNIRV